ncbi:MAG TPA: hypothetical protein VKT17_01960 [Acidobacteriota bacterium]|nr:hypothetical protein [Acidobacteriota bacterium]
MRCSYRAGIGTFALWVLVSGFASAAPGADPPAPQKVKRWQSNLSLGAVSNGRIGIVKSFWWFAVPRVVALGLSFDYVTEAIPLSLNVALNAPIPVVSPFVCAGAGAGLNGSGITHYGGGLRVRLGRRFGLVAEYRTYRYLVVVHLFPRIREKASADYFGAGISWLY